MAQATCAHCGDPFEPVNGNQIYCRDRCRWSAKARMQAARNAVAETRRCSRCQEVKPAPEFGATHTYCKPCNNEVQREWRAANPDRRKEYRRRNYANTLAGDPEHIRKTTLRKFGLTLESFADLLAKQDGKCAICGTADPAGRHGNWHVDHDRKCCPTTKSCGRCIRGLLCQNCNLMLGHAKDDPVILGFAVTYLAKYTKL